MTVGLVIVSHSAKVAEGVVDLAGQMAEEVRVLAAGGNDDGEIGTSATRIAAAIEAADSGDGALVLFDLGSALLSARMAIEELVGDEYRERVRISKASLVEGAVIGAIEASIGSSLEEVDQAATRAATEVKAKA